MNYFSKSLIKLIYKKFVSLVRKEIFEEELVFIHIGKCAGTSMISNFHRSKNKIKIFHMKRPSLHLKNENKRYFFIVRNPLERFVSAFNYSKSIIEFDIDNIDIESLSIENCPAPFWIKRRINNNGVAMTKTYDSLIQSFRNANELAESLSSSNYFLRSKAERLMRDNNQHIFKGIGWYLHNGNFIKLFNKKIVFVGRLEYLSSDLAKLKAYESLNKLSDISILDINFDFKRLRKTNNKYDKYLSKKAINNLKKFYKKSDYLTLNILNEYGFIDSSTLFEYNNYSN